MKRNILKVLKWSGFLLLVLITPLLIGILVVKVDPYNYSNNFPSNPRIISFDTYSKNQIIDSLEEFRNKKQIEKYTAATLIALSRYPELMDVEISFKITDSGAPLESSFNIPTLLMTKSERKYIIYLLEDQGTMFDPILVKNLPFDAQVGIIAHELGHTAYYHNLSFWQILKWAVLYEINPEFRAIHERSTDLVPVYRGLGWQIHHYAEYVRTSPETKELYDMGKFFIDKFYMTHLEIMDKMEDLGY